MTRVDTNRYPSPSLDALLLHYGSEKRRQKMLPLYAEMLAAAADLAEIAVIYEEVPLMSVAGLQEWCPRETTAVILAICTLGTKLDNAVQAFVQDDLLKAVILKEIALAWIVSIVNGFHGRIRAHKQTEGLKAGPAFRPGVGRWPIETQRILFAHLAADKIGVSLDEHLFMKPLLSTSLIIPIMDRRQKNS